ncbi:hypothetical protein D3C84_564640 [compost metagenome]
MVQCATGQVDHLHGGGGDRSGAVCIVEAQQPIRIRDVQIVADQGHAKGRVEVFNERGAGFGVAVVVGVAQQGDAVRAGHAGTGARHDFFGDPADHACAVIRLGWGVGFGHQHIAIGQHIQPAWVFEPFGECHHLGAGRGNRLGTAWPAHGGGDIHGRDQGLVRLRQRG